MSASASPSTTKPMPSFRKDATLDRLAEQFNVAQFVSFAPSSAGPDQQFCRVAGYEPNHAFKTVRGAVEALFQRAAYGTVNIRSYSAQSSQSREFLYGLRRVDEVVDGLNRLSAEGSYTIANETIDVSDGGVSGVVIDDVVEFKPDATPRGVERAGFATLPADWAGRAFNLIYGVSPDFDQALGARLEFTIHPSRRGFKRSHVLYWEFGEHGPIELAPSAISWPNDFSRMMGDKAYGLLIAHLAGFAVPQTNVIGRRLPPFVFGEPTGSLEWWTRTCPTEPVPGKYTTTHGWTDPFKLLADEDAGGSAIASVLCQRDVPAAWSGAAIEAADGSLYIEGVAGNGDAFMQGSAAPATLPGHVTNAIDGLHRRLQASLGSVRFEWVFDGTQAWVVQLHRGRSPSAGQYIVPGEADQWITFRVADGLEALRKRIAQVPNGSGLILDGEVGLTSHVADVVRKAGVPARIAAPTPGGTAKD